MSGRPCHFCGAANAPFGFRRRGFPRDIPVAARAGFWACSACRDKGAALKAEKEAALDPFASKRPAEQGAQADLFGGSALG